MNSKITSRLALAVLVVFLGTNLSIGDVAAQSSARQWTGKEKQVVSRIGWARGQMRGFAKKIRSAKPPANTIKRGPLAVNAYTKVLLSHSRNYRGNTDRYITRSVRILQRLKRNESAAERKNGLRAVSENLLRLHKKDLSKMLNHIKGSPDARALRNQSRAIVGKLNEAVKAARAL